MAAFEARVLIVARTFRETSRFPPHREDRPAILMRAFPGVCSCTGLGPLAVGLLRRVVLRKSGSLSAPGVNVGLIDAVARYALSRSSSVLIEGILHSVVYAEMLRRLRDDHPGPTRFFYLDVPLDETLRRHQARPEASEFTESDMRG